MLVLVCGMRSEARSRRAFINGVLYGSMQDLIHPHRARECKGKLQVVWFQFFALRGVLGFCLVSALLVALASRAAATHASGIAIMGSLSLSAREPGIVRWPERWTSSYTTQTTSFASATTSSTLPIRASFSSSITVVSPRRLYSPRPPPLLPRTHLKGPPSIPVRDLAWGYEEDADGILRLQQPTAKHELNSSRGPGTYSPSSELTLPSAPKYDFGRSTGRYPTSKLTQPDRVPAPDEEASPQAGSDPAAAGDPGDDPARL